MSIMLLLQIHDKFAPWSNTESSIVVIIIMAVDVVIVYVILPAWWLDSKLRFSLVHQNVTDLSII